MNHEPSRYPIGTRHLPILHQENRSRRQQNRGRRNRQSAVQLQQSQSRIRRQQDFRERHQRNNPKIGLRSPIGQRILDHFRGRLNFEAAPIFLLS